MDSSELAQMSPAEKAAFLKELLTKKASQEAGMYPLSVGQQAMWFMHQTDPGSPAYNTGFAVRIQTSLHTDSFRKALQKVHNRHAVLSSVYVWKNDELVQQVQGFQEIYFQVIDASEWDAATLHARVTQAYQRPFQLDTGPITRSFLFQCGLQDWVFLFSVHHIAYDEWSAQILLPELLTLYEAERQQTTAKLPVVAKSYLDYVSYQKSYLDSEKSQQDWLVWQQLLADVPVQRLLPPDKIPVNPLRSSGNSVHFQLSPAHTQQLRHFCQQEGVTVFTALLAVFQVLLHRFSAQKDMVLGIPTAGRNQTDFYQTIGYFVNLVPVRSQLHTPVSFRTFLQQIYPFVTQALACQDFPFPWLVDRLQLQREADMHPLFQVAFSYLNHKDMAHLFPAEASMPISPYLIPSQDKAFDLMLEMKEEATHIQGIFKYDTDLYEPATIQTLCTHFSDLLPKVLQAADVPVQEISLVTELEQAQIRQWNQTTTAYPRQCSLVALFAEQVQATPQARAIVSQDDTYTYAQLDEQATQLAHYLHNVLQVQPGQLVGLVADYSPWLLIGIWGILKAGAAYVPILPDTPESRVQFICNDTCLSVLLCDHATFAATHATVSAIIFEYRKQWQTIAGYQSVSPLPVSMPTDLAYVMYTSGSTGTPKGVMVEHRNVVRLVKNTNYVSIHDTDQLLQLSNYAFDGSVFDIFGALLNGATLHLMPTDVVLSSQALANYIQNQGITKAFCTTALFHILAENQPECLRVLDVLLIGGETLSMPIIRQALAYQKREGSLVNIYGPTECTTFSTFYPILSLEAPIRAVPIGRPVANGTVYILDENQQILPPGMMGEIYIGGDGVARGYLNQPELTAEKFIQAPFAPEERLYATGDLGKWLPDGSVQFAGRRDNQIKLRGYRIELGEIEAMLQACPLVKEGVIWYQKSEEQSGYLVAVVVPYPTNVSATDIQAYLKTVLPSYMIPSDVRILQAMPLTANGKIDRQALSAMRVRSGQTSAGFVPPHTEIQQQVAKIWQELLQVPAVGLQDDFFALGGHSLLAARILARLRSTWGVEIPISVLFRSPTVETMAQYIEKQQQLPAEQMAIPRASREQFRRKT